MHKRIETYLELLEGAKAAFATATSLSKLKNHGVLTGAPVCFYEAGKIEGSPGCGLGWAFPREIGAILDRKGDKSASTEITAIIRNPELRALVEVYIDIEGVESHKLLRLQRYHDHSDTVEQFRSYIEHEIEITNNPPNGDDEIPF